VARKWKPHAQLSSSLAADPDLVLACEHSCHFISSSPLLLTKARPSAMDSPIFWASEHNAHIYTESKHEYLWGL
jgi:hypothetical protein